MGRRWPQTTTGAFQGRGEQGNLKQRGHPLGAVPFRALVSIMASRGTSPLCLFTLGKPSTLPPGLKPSPLLATAQSLDLGALHGLFLSQPASAGPKLQGAGCLMKRRSLLGSSGCSHSWYPLAGAGAEEHTASSEPTLQQSPTYGALALCWVLLAAV